MERGGARRRSDIIKAAFVDFMQLCNEKMLFPKLQSICGVASIILSMLSVTLLAYEEPLVFLKDNFVWLCVVLFCIWPILFGYIKFCVLEFLAIARNRPLESTMKAIVAIKYWFSRTLEEREVTVPEIKDNEVLIKVWAVGVNKDDFVDVATGVNCFYPGLECSGIIEAVGRNVNCWKVGERVCAILEGGGYAEQVVVPADFLLPVPDDIDLDDAAGLPYASCCIWLALFKMQTPETLKDKIILIREGYNGIDSLAIQYAKYMGLKVIASTGNSDNLLTDDYYGADFCVDHTSRRFVSVVLKKTGHLGVDFVLDYGASDLQRNIDCLNIGGKIAIVDLGGENCISINFIKLGLMQSEIKVINLPSKDFQYKASVIAGVKADLWPAVLQKKVVPATDYPFLASEAGQALDRLKNNDSTRKIIVRMDFEKSSMDFEKSSGHIKMQ